MGKEEKCRLEQVYWLTVLFFRQFHGANMPLICFLHSRDLSCYYCCYSLLTYCCSFLHNAFGVSFCSVLTGEVCISWHKDNIFLYICTNSWIYEVAFIYWHTYTLWLFELAVRKFLLLFIHWSSIFCIHDSREHQIKWNQTENEQKTRK